jgi:hypothetical protein
MFKTIVATCVAGPVGLNTAKLLGRTLDAPWKVILPASSAAAALAGWSAYTLLEREGREARIVGSATLHEDDIPD